jgi:hypothetical protein
MNVLEHGGFAVRDRQVEIVRRRLLAKGLLFVLLDGLAIQQRVTDLL